MFDTFFGLPVHALVVHSVIVLLPLTCLGAFAVVAVPRWNLRYGFLVVGCGAIATVSAFVAVASGRELASRIGEPVAHASVAKWTPWISLVLLGLLTALWWQDRSRLSNTDRSSGRRSRRTTGAKVLAAMTAVAALVALVWAIRAGHSGATAVWEQVVKSTTPGSQPVQN